MLRPDTQGAQSLQQSVQAVAGQRDRLPAITDLDFGGSTVDGEQVAALPLRSDVGVRHRLQPGNHDGLVQRLGIAELSLALGGGFPMLGQQANHRLAAGIGLLQRLLPPFPGPDAGVGVQVQEISSASPGSCSISHALTATASRLSRLE